MKSIIEIISLQYRHDRFWFLLGICVALVPVVAGLALLGVAGWFITAAAIAGLTAAFLNIFVPSAMIRGLAIARTIGRYGERLITHDATFRFLSNLRLQVFKGAASGSLARTGLTRSALMLNRMTTDIAALDAVYLRLVVPALLAVSAAVLASVIFGVFSIWFILPLGAFLIASGALYRIPTGAEDQKAARRQEASLDAVRVRTVDLVAGRRDLAIYGGLGDAAASVEFAAERLVEAEKHQDHRAAQMTSYSFLSGQVLFAVLIIVLGSAVLSGALELPVAVGLLLFALALPDVFSGLVPGALAFARTRLAARRILRSLENADMFDRIFSTDGNSASGRMASLGEANQTLTFENVSFGYGQEKEQVLNAFSMSVAGGEVVALIGRSGCGKSTVSSLASRVLVPTSGTITLLGEPLSQWSEADLRSNVTVLSQRPYLFQGSIADNLRIANPSASDEELWTALDAAALAPRIRESVDGLQAVVGEGGLGFSGGEQRRLGLARAYLTQPRLWILDELTEGLDPATAEDVLARFFQFRGKAAVLMIAHKDLEIRRADRVLNLGETGCLIQVS